MSVLDLRVITRHAGRVLGGFFATERHFIACFVKAGPSAWEHVGHCCVRRVIADAVELRARARAASRPPGDLSMVLLPTG